MMMIYKVYLALWKDLVTTSEFVLDKYAKIPFRKGSLAKSKNITLDINMEIIELEDNKTYKHFGINEVNHTIIRAKLRTELFTKSKVVSINSLAIRVLIFNFDIIDWLWLK